MKQTVKQLKHSLRQQIFPAILALSTLLGAGVSLAAESVPVGPDSVGRSRGAKPTETTVIATIISGILGQVNFKQASVDFEVSTGLHLEGGTLSLFATEQLEGRGQIGFKGDISYPIDKFISDLPAIEGLAGWKPELKIEIAGVTVDLYVNAREQEKTLIGEARLLFRKNSNNTAIRIVAKNDLNSQLIALRFRGIDIKLSQIRRKANTINNISGICHVDKEINTLNATAPIKIVETECQFESTWNTREKSFDTQIKFVSKKM